jgi:stage V sporulation protein S
MSDFEIRVSGGTDPNRLAGSISAAFSEGKEVVLCTIGPGPTNQAVKAVCVANRFLASQGVLLGIIPGLCTRLILDKESQREIPWVVTILRLKNIMAG